MITICIPSYNRDHPSTLERLYPQLPHAKVRVIIFIRKDALQRQFYSHYRDRMDIVELDDVTDIGETRKAIVDYCIHQRISSIFMLDDDITVFSKTVMKDGRLKPIVSGDKASYKVNIDSFIEAHRIIRRINKTHPRKIGICGFTPYAHSWVPSLDKDVFYELRRNSVQCVCG